MAAIPVIAEVSVFYRPESAQADEDIFAMVVWMDIAKCEMWAAAVVNNAATFRPDYCVGHLMKIAAVLPTSPAAGVCALTASPVP